MENNIYYTQIEDKRIISLNYFGQTSYWYNLIPDEIITDKSILDIGANNGLLQLGSRHKDKFLLNDYLGIDVNPPETVHLPIIQADLFNFKPEKLYDLVICIEVLEHIALRDWSLAFKKLKSFTKKDGCLFITVPHNQHMNSYLHKMAKLPYHQKHVVFGITERTVHFFLNNADIHTVKHPSLWREPNEGYIKPTLRLIKRFLTRHHYFKHGIVAIWKKSSK